MVGCPISCMDLILRVKMTLCVILGLGESTHWVMNLLFSIIQSLGIEYDLLDGWALFRSHYVGDGWALFRNLFSSHWLVIHQWFTRVFQGSVQHTINIFFFCVPGNLLCGLEIKDFWIVTQTMTWASWIQFHSNLLKPTLLPSWLDNVEKATSQIKNNKASTATVFLLQF